MCFIMKRSYNGYINLNHGDGHQCYPWNMIINSILFISGDECGICLLSARPAKKAPIIGSICAYSATTEARKTIAITKMYSVPLSPS